MSSVRSSQARGKIYGKYAAEEVKARFAAAVTHQQYRRALRFAKRLDKHSQLVVLEALFEAADRLNVDRASGVALPKVTPRGNVTVRGKAVVVEVLT